MTWHDVTIWQQKPREMTSKKWRAIELLETAIGFGFGSAPYDEQ